ncbi:MAG: hypothetical protein KDC46_02360 [Thermoleophilia bacterium]|nr:hypothetical protein [Thermoleophilia bacterium]
MRSHANLPAPVSGALALAIVLVLAIACAGCTPRQSQDQYEERLGNALAVRDSVSSELSGNQLTDAKAYDEAAAKVSAALDELDADPPPSNVKDAHERMVSGMEGLSVLLKRLGRCEALATASAQDRRACRQSIGQDVYDTIRNDFTEANTIYRQEGLSLAGLGSGDETGGGDSLGGENSDGGDEL